MVILVEQNSLTLFLVISEASVEQELLANQNTRSVFLRIIKLSIVCDAGSGLLESINNYSIVPRAGESVSWSFERAEAFVLVRFPGASELSLALSAYPCSFLSVGWKLANILLALFFKNSEAVSLIPFKETLVLTLRSLKSTPLLAITFEVTSEAFGAPWPILDSKTMLLDFVAHRLNLTEVNFALAAN